MGFSWVGPAAEVEGGRSPKLGLLHGTMERAHARSFYFSAAFMNCLEEIQLILVELGIFYYLFIIDGPSTKLLSSLHLLTGFLGGSCKWHGIRRFWLI